MIIALAISLVLNAFLGFVLWGAYLQSLDLDARCAAEIERIDALERRIAEAQR